jgi:signal transduction histidine kinase
MTLGRKMAYQTAAMIIGLLMIGAASLWGINRLYADYAGVAIEAYAQLREVYDIRSDVRAAEELLTTTPPQRELAGRAVKNAISKFGTGTASGVSPESNAGATTGPDAGSAPEAPGAAIGSSDASPTGASGYRVQHAAVRQRLQAAYDQLRDPAVRPSDGGRADDTAALNRVFVSLDALDGAVRDAMRDREQAVRANRRTTVVALAALAGVTILGALVLGVLQYRDVVLPLSGLAWAVRRITRGRFSDRVDFGARGRPSRYPAEFVRLADDFNRMASELDELYHKLEAKVAAKSKELVRSERLASVGYLAAGVAHEINNPLGIIVGYAECLMMELKERQAAAAKARRLKGGAAGAGGGGDVDRDADDADAVMDDIAKTLQIICDEAFRCKTITHKLLSMAKPGEDARRPVNLGDVAAGVVSVLGGVRPFRDRRLSVRAESAARDDLVVTAVEAEMKQVVMNLAINALEAIAPPESSSHNGGSWSGDGSGADGETPPEPDAPGEVRIHIARRGGSVELTVSDTGKGMSAQTLERVFEPFFTEKRGAGTDMVDQLPQAAAAEGLERRHGTGLGLSITHAIVEAHGGRITAQSDGPGKGSVFTVRLPATVAVPSAVPELTKFQ